MLQWDKKEFVMKYLFILFTLIFLGGCVSTPYANIGASKTVNIGGIDVGVGAGTILHP